VYTCTNEIYRPKKYFYVSLGNNFTVFCGRPLVVEALGNCPVCSLLNPALCKRRKQRIRKTTQTYTTYTIYYTTLLETVQYKKRKSISQFVRVLSRKSSVTVWRIWRHTRGRKQLIIFFASDPLYDVNVINTTFIHIYDVTWVSVFFVFVKIFHALN